MYMRGTFSLWVWGRSPTRPPNKWSQKLFLIFSLLLLPLPWSQASIALILSSDKQNLHNVDQDKHLASNPSEWYKKQLLHFRYPDQKELFLTDPNGATHHMVFKDDGNGLTFDGLYYRLYSKTLDCFVTILTFRGTEQWVFLDVRTQTFIPITSRDQEITYDAIATLVGWFTAGKDYVAAPKPGNKEAKSWFVRVH